jgi:hypothetical protein
VAPWAIENKHHPHRIRGDSTADETTARRSTIESPDRAISIRRRTRQCSIDAPKESRSRPGLVRAKPQSWLKTSAMQVQLNFPSANRKRASSRRVVPKIEKPLRIGTRCQVIGRRKPRPNCSSLLHFLIPNLSARRQNRKHDCAIGEKSRKSVNDAGLVGGSGHMHARLRTSRRPAPHASVCAKLDRGSASTRVVAIDLARYTVPSALLFRHPIGAICG